MLGAFGFFGKSGAVVAVGTLYAQDVRTSPTNSTATLTFGRNGTIVGTGNVQATTRDWITPRESDSGDDYEVEIHVNSGDTPTGITMDTWTALSSDQTLTLTQTVVGSKSSVLRVKIRRAADSVVVAEGLAYMDAEEA